MCTFCAFQRQGASYPIRKFQDQERRKKRNQRKRKSVSNPKGDAGVEGENSEEVKMEVAETQSTQTEENLPVGTQHVDRQSEQNVQTVENIREQRHKDVEMVQAHTQTEKRKDKNKFTQTRVIPQTDKGTQTDLPKQEDTHNEKTRPKKDKHTPEAKLQGAPQTENPDNVGASSDSAKEQNPRKASKEEIPTAGSSVDPIDSQADKGAKQKSYANAVSGEGTSRKQSDTEASRAEDKTMKPSQSTR